MLLAVAICTMLWLVWDNWLGMRMLRWLKKAICAPPWAYNPWAEVADTASLPPKHNRETAETRCLREDHPGRPHWRGAA